jgi:hypothetical protein
VTHPPSGRVALWPEKNQPRGARVPCSRLCSRRGAPASAWDGHCVSALMPLGAPTFLLFTSNGHPLIPYSFAHSILPCLSRRPVPSASPQTDALALISLLCSARRPLLNWENLLLFPVEAPSPHCRTALVGLFASFACREVPPSHRGAFLSILASLQHGTRGVFRLFCLSRGSTCPSRRLPLDLDNFLCFCRGALFSIHSRHLDPFAAVPIDAPVEAPSTRSLTGNPGQALSRRPLLDVGMGVSH